VKPQSNWISEFEGLDSFGLALIRTAQRHAIIAADRHIMSIDAATAFGMTFANSAAGRPGEAPVTKGTTRMNIQRRILTNLAIAACFAAVSVSSASAQPSGSRFEVGGQLSTLQVSGSDLSAIHAGVGGRFVYNLTDWASLEAEGNYFPNDNVTFDSSTPSNDLRVEYRRTRAEAFFGPKLGVRFQRFGIFGKVRPGFAHLSDGGTACTGSACAAANLLAPSYRTEFALDLGGVFEFYPSSRIVARLDLGDTAIRYRSVAPPYEHDAMNHSFTSRIGFGVRF